MLTPLKDTVWPSPSDPALVTDINRAGDSTNNTTVSTWGGGKCCQRNISPLGKMWTGTLTRQMSKSICRHIPSSIYVSVSRWASCENHCVSAAHSALAIIGKIPQRGMFITALGSGERTRTACMTGEANSDLCLRQTPSISLGLGERWTLLLGICEKWGSVEGKCNECRIHRCLLQGKRLFHILRENRIFQSRKCIFKMIPNISFLFYHHLFPSCQYLI